ncbi:TrkH family potassium uptake protein [Candidatus Micrarchaeota archaeon]|nr:TrkH family potassium uptake protein [Candidatus Micrarchaeota archaeon]
MLGKISTVMFYASLPLLIPFSYSIYLGDGGWLPIGATILLLAFPAVPGIILGIFQNLVNFIKSVVNRDTPFNSAVLIDMNTMKNQVDTLTLGEILTLTSIVWIVVPAIATIPYVYYNVPIMDAFFESMSGWTSTGLSALPTISSLPESIIFFRSTSQWIGGLGIVILLLLTLRGREAIGLLKAEGRNMLDMGISETMNTIFKAYLFLTILGIMILFLLGLDIFNSVNLTFSGISNGGFFPFDDFEFTNMQKVALAGLMFAGATSFLFYRNIWKGIVSKSIFDEEFLLYVLITASAVALIAFAGGGEFFNTALNTVSAIAAGGFAIGDLSILSGFSVYLLVLLMLCGGMFGSTTGGIKLWRILVIFKAVINHIKKAFLPAGSVKVVKINNGAIDDREIVESVIFVFTYIFIFLFAGGVFLLANYSLENSVFLVASAMGNVGLSTVSIPAIGFNGKAFIILLMYLGRIEIFPSLALISYIIRR